MKRLVVSVAAVTVMALSSVPAAQAAFGIASLEGGAENSAGASYTQAGGHPYQLRTDIQLNTTNDSEGTLLPDGGNVKDVVAHLPAGFVGNVEALPRCALVNFYETVGGGSSTGAGCSGGTAVGKLTVSISFGSLSFPLQLPVYNLTPPSGVIAEFGTTLAETPILLFASVRSGGDYGIDITSPNVSQALQVLGTEATFWGVPADPSHDEERGSCLSFFGPTGSSCPAGVGLKPFLTMPTSCEGPQTTTVAVDSWSAPGAFDEGSFVTHDDESPPNPVGFEGCDKLSFSPRLDAQPDGAATSSPSGLTVKDEMPQNQLPQGLAEANMKEAKVTLPKGVSISPAAAAGLDACSEEEIGLHRSEPAHCPESSKVGDVKITTPVLPDPLEGALYVARQNENPFDALLAGYLVAEGPGIVIKQAGKFSLDAGTGQVTATFENIPQQPFSDLELKVYGGPHAVLQMPDACGTYTTHYELTPWSGTAPVSGQSSFQIDEGCDTGGFNPKLSAGTTNPVAGAHSPFVFDTTRNDGEQNIAAINVDLPKGLTAKIAGIPLCGDADAGSGNCPAASQVGVVNAAVGAGSSPLWVPQAGKEATAVYLAGPYKGAPYSIVAKVPAQAGPFDLGTVAVRSKVNVDPETAQVSVQSDPLPQILQGIPIDYREVQVNVERPDFMLNPTSCEAMSIDSSISSDAGAIAHPSSRFQVGSCGDLGFSPKLAIRLFGPTKRGGHPRLRAVVTPKPGEANIGRAAVTLPRSEFLDQAHIKTICTRVQFAANACPAGSVYGYAKAWTPLLDQPLQGPVYLRSSEHKLPDLVADLNGQIHIVLDGRIDSVHKGIRTTFEGVPDAPVSRFVLNMQGGKKGLLINSRDICAHKFRANSNLKGQNGRLSRTRPLVRNGRCGDAKRKHHHHRGVR